MGHKAVIYIVSIFTPFSKVNIANILFTEVKIEA